MERIWRFENIEEGQKGRMPDVSQPQWSQVVISVWCNSKRAVHMKRNADGSLKIPTFTA